MKNVLSALAIVVTSTGASLAFETSDYLSVRSCNPFSGSFEQCAFDQMADCKHASETKGDGYHDTRLCSNEYFDQADDALNEFYQEALIKTKAVEYSLAGSAYQGQEELLRQGQRAWLQMRDATCGLSVLYGAVMSGFDSTIAGCKARLTVRRIGDLQEEIGDYLK